MSQFVQATRTLSGLALDVAVELALGYEVRALEAGAPIYKEGFVEGIVHDRTGKYPIDDLIDAHRISSEVAGDGWAALVNDCFCDATQRKVIFGATRREAILRSFVQHVLGDKVTLPRLRNDSHA